MRSLSVRGRTQGVTSVWHSLARRLARIPNNRATMDTSIATAHSNAAIQRWLSEGTPLQCARGCARVMRLKIRPLGRGEENASVILQALSLRALESCVIFFWKPHLTGRIRSGFQRAGKIFRACPLRRLEKPRLRIGPTNWTRATLSYSRSELVHCSGATPIGDVPADVAASPRCGETRTISK